LLEWIRAGIPIALGTDGEACNPDLDILAEASTLFQMHPDIPPAKILEMCTINGAAVLGWKGKAGALAPGHYADMLSMATDSASTLEKMLENLLVSKPKSMKTLWRGKWR
jgi:cytosine/adenosine deaminase-related metal-dependent hydrolase